MLPYYEYLLQKVMDFLTSTYAILFVAIGGVLLVVVFILLKAVQRKKQRYEDYARKADFFRSFQYRLEQMAAALDENCDIDFSIRNRTDFPGYYHMIINNNLDFFAKKVNPKTLEAIDTFIELQTMEAYKMCIKAMKDELIRDKKGLF